MSTLRATVIVILLAFLFPCLNAQQRIAATSTGMGPSVIFIPALGCPPDVWNPIVGRLSSSYTCRVISIAGFGGVPAVGSPDFGKVREEIVAYAETSHQEKPILVGHSMGGMLALSVAASHPTLFRKLVIVDAVPFPMGLMNPNTTHEQAIQQGKAVQNFILQQDSVSLRKFLRASMAIAVRDSANLKTIVDWMAASDRATFAEAQYEMLGTDLRPELARITVPTLVIGTWVGREAFGINDSTLPALLKAQYANLKNCTFTISPTSRHFVMFDDPDWLAEQLQGFFRQ
jgi:N-formylmaleamate deformylase